MSQRKDIREKCSLKTYTSLFNTLDGHRGILGVPRLWPNHRQIEHLSAEDFSSLMSAHQIYEDFSVYGMAKDGK